KYGISIIVILFFISAVVVFYISESYSVSKLPEFVIKHQSGNDDLVDSLNIEAGLKLGSVHRFLNITSDGTKYDTEKTYLERLKYGQPSIHSDQAIDELIEKHRHFMRGKLHAPSALYEDDEYLVYVTIDGDDGSLSAAPSSFTFDVSVLDKKTDNTS